MTNKENIEDIFPACYLQKGMLLESEIRDDWTYHDFFVYKINYKFDYDRFSASFGKLVRKYPLLRASFVKNDNYGYVCVVHKEISLEKKIVIELELPVSEIIRREKLNKLSFTNAGLFKLIIAEQGDGYFNFILSFHHAMADGWSIMSIMAEFIDLYMGKAVDCAPFSHTYGEYILEEQKVLKDESFKEFWKNYLKGYEAPSDNFALERNEKTYEDFHTVSRQLTAMQSEKIIAAAKECKVSPDIIFTSLYLMLLYSFYRKNDIIIGLVVNDRMEVEEGEKLFGLFLNTIPLRQNVSDRTGIRELVKAIYQDKLKLFKYKKYPYGRIKSDLKLKSDIYQCVFNYVHFHVLEKGGGRPDIEFSETHERTNIQLQLNVERKGDVFSFNFKGHDNFIDGKTILRFSDYLLYYIDQFVSGKDILSLILPSELAKVVHDWNRTEVLFPKDVAIHQLIEQQAEKTPENIAVIFEDSSMTYRELNQKANRMARKIRKEYKSYTGKGMEKDTMVGIYIDRSFEMMIGILGILKAGAAYVPFDTADSNERTEYKINDSECSLILTSSNYADALSKYIKSDTLILSIDSIENELASEPDSNLKIYYPDGLAYMIYTSGSTGKPKGTMLEHRGLVNRLLWMKEEYNFNDKDKVLQKTPYSFDVSVWELLLPFISSSIQVIARPQGHKDPHYLAGLIENTGVTKLHFVPSMLNGFVNALVDDKNIKLNSITDIICSGEALGTDLAKRTVNFLPHIRLHNLYGPTEATIDASYHEFERDRQYGSSIPIGKPVQNYTLYILDANFNPVPIGIQGELYIGGVGLARGYYNRPELTKERFINNPFASDYYKNDGYDKMYKTGDVTRWLHDGNIEYIGRNDDQIKIRGLRVELGEIESVLGSSPKVSHCAVIAREKDGNKYIAGYYVEKSPVDESELIEFMKKKLPEYMIPSVFMKLDRIPLNNSGKVDRKVLPEPVFKSNESSYRAPSTEMEKAMVSIWMELLHLDKIGIDDDFFLLGGDSIQSIQLVSRMRKKGIMCSVRNVTEHKTISNIIRHLSLDKKADVAAEQGILEGSFDLLPIQCWFFEKHLKKPDHWNQAFMIMTEELDVNKLKDALKKLSEHHDSLRLKFSGGKQCYQKAVVIPEIRILNTNGLNRDDIFRTLSEWQDKFDIENGPLWIAGYLTGYDDGSARIFIAAHHLVIDAVSWRILAEDIISLYHGKKLEKKTTSYRQWAETTKKYSKEKTEELSYWHSIIEGQPDYGCFKNNDTELKRFVMLDMDKTRQLLKLANKAYTTEINDLLLTAAAYAFKTIHNSNVSYVTLEGHGRENIADNIDLSRTTGWFTSIYPVKLSVTENISESITHVKKSLREIPNKGIGYSIHKYFRTSQELSGHKLPLIAFNYLGMLDNQCCASSILLDNIGEIVHPENPSPYVVDINCWVANGELTFSVNGYLSPEKMNEFLESLKSNTENIVKHCVLQLQEEFQLSPVQNWVFKWADDDPNKYVGEYSFLIREGTDTDRLLESIRKTINSVDVFHLRFINKDGKWTQYYSSSPGVFAEIRSISLSLDIEKDISLRKQATDIRNGKLGSFVIYNNGGKYKLSILIHKLAFDGVSTEILLDKFEREYNGKRDNTGDSVIFAEYVKELNAYANTKQFEQDVENFKKFITPPISVNNTSRKGLYIKSIDIPLTSVNKNAIFMQSMSAFCNSMSLLKKTDNVYIHFIDIGRNILNNMDLYKNIGYFVTHTPVVFNLPGVCSTEMKRNELEASYSSVERQFNGLKKYLGLHGMARWYNGKYMKEFMIHDDIDIMFNYFSVDDVQQDNRMFTLEANPITQHDVFYDDNNIICLRMMVGVTVTPGSMNVAIAHAKDYYSDDFVNELLKDFSHFFKSIQETTK